MSRRWFLLLISLFIPAGTSTLDEETTAVAPSTKMEDIIPGDPDNSKAHQLFKRRFTGYKDFNKYRFTKSKGRIHTIFLRNPYDMLVRSKRSNSGMLRTLKSIFVNHSQDSNSHEQILPEAIGDNAIDGKEKAEDEEENYFNNKLFSRIDKTLTKLNNKLETMEKETENAFIMFKVPVPINDKGRKFRAKRESNDLNENRHDDDSNITVIALTKPNNQQTTTEPSLSAIEVKVDDTSNNSIVLVITHNETNKNDSASFVEPPLDTNKTEIINTEEIDNKTLSLAELRDETRRSKEPNDYIHKMEEILDEIHKKLSPLNRIKETHSMDEKYKVGYIIANLESAVETIERLLSKLKTRETLPKHQVQNILDKVTLSRMVVSNLMNFLGSYTNSPAISEDIVN